MFLLVLFKTKHEPIYFKQFHIAPNCFKYFSEFAFTLAAGFMLSDFLKFFINTQPQKKI